MAVFIWETAEELDQKLADRLRNIRRRRKISQEELSRQSGVSLGTKRFDRKSTERGEECASMCLRITGMTIPKTFPFCMMIPAISGT